MAFLNLPVQVIIFVMFLVVSGGFAYFIIYGSADARSLQEQELSDRTGEADSYTVIEFAAYNSTTKITSVYVRNIGRRQINVNKSYLFLENFFYTANQSDQTTNNFNYTILSDTIVVDNDLWDPGEVLQIDIEKALPSSRYSILLVSEYDTRAAYSFTAGIVGSGGLGGGGIGLG